MKFDKVKNICYSIVVLRGNIMSCRYYCWNGGSFFGDYWCQKDNKKVSENDYRKYCRDYNYSSCPIYKKSDSGCFLTTIICNVLNKKDNDIVLENMRYFRNNVLQKDKEFEVLLKDYDNIGPLIAQSISLDKDRNYLCQKLYDDVLFSISSDIENKNYKRAIIHYEVMTLSLINYYGYKHCYNNMRDNEYDYEIAQDKLGHGKKYCK